MPPLVLRKKKIFTKKKTEENKLFLRYRYPYTHTHTHTLEYMVHRNNIIVAHILPSQVPLGK